MSTAEEPTLRCGPDALWNRNGFPRRGWQTVKIEDRERDDDICQACDLQYIRYVHHLRHPLWADVVEVGCICAGHLMGDYDAARSAESKVRSASRKKARLHRFVDGFRETEANVFRHDAGIEISQRHYGYRVRDLNFGGGGWFDTFSDAVAACLDRRRTMLSKPTLERMPL